MTTFVDRRALSSPCRSDAAIGARRPGSTAWVVALFALAIGGVPGTLAASDLDQEMGEVAKNIKQLLDERGQDAIAVGDFRGPAKLAASAGPSISKALTDQLKKANVLVKRRASLEVNGDYRDVEDKQKKMLAVEIKAQVVDSSGTPIVQFQPRGVFNLTTIASLLGATVSMPANSGAEAREESFSKAIDEPKVQLANTRISAGKESPYAIEILVKEKGELRPRAASVDSDGFAFLKIRRSEIYAIRLINDSPHDAAVTLTIDGLSLFAFSENTNYTVLIVPAGKDNTVPGWHRNNRVSDSFQVTEYSKSAVAKQLPNSAAVGTITACFAAAWPQDKSPPDDEPKVPEGARAGDATGQGPPVEKSYTEVVRNLGRLRASVSVRYTKDEDPKDLPASKP